MREKQSLTRETALRYRTSDRKGKKTILDEFVRTAGYNRKYAIHLLSNWGKEQVRMVDGQAVKLVIGAPRKHRKRKGKRVYDEAVGEALKKWFVFPESDTSWRRRTRKGMMDKI